MKLRLHSEDEKQDAVIMTDAFQRIANVLWQEDGSHIAMARLFVEAWNDPDRQEALRDRKRRLGPMA